jgi:hypothetical protein
MSRRFMLLMASNCRGLRHLYEEGGVWRAIHHAAPIARRDAIKAQSAAIDKALGDCENAALSLRADPDPLKIEASRQALIKQGYPLKVARKQIEVLLAELGQATLGFNESDGD